MIQLHQISYKKKRHFNSDMVKNVFLWYNMLNMQNFFSKEGSLW